jgi:transposase
MNREEIRAVYRQGEDAVIALVEGLLQRIAKLEEHVEGLENQQGKNSRNSSKPPSSDGSKPKPKSLGSKSERSSGG